MKLSDEQLKQKLTPEQYNVLRKKGTEAPFSGEYVHPMGDGTFSCVVCGNILFEGKTQYESSVPGLQGWPSFADVAKSGSVKLVDDNSFGMHRTEVVCANCGSHLGHVFDGDNASPTGKHYCINSCALDFKKQV